MTRILQKEVFPVETCENAYYAICPQWSSIEHRCPLELHCPLLNLFGVSVNSEVHDQTAHNLLWSFAVVHRWHMDIICTPRPISYVNSADHDQLSHPVQTVWMCRLIMRHTVYIRHKYFFCKMQLSLLTFIWWISFLSLFFKSILFWLRLDGLQ